MNNLLPDQSQIKYGQRWEIQSDLIGRIIGEVISGCPGHWKVKEFSSSKDLPGTFSYSMEDKYTKYVLLLGQEAPQEI